MRFNVSVTELVRFENTHHFIGGKKPAKDVTCATVEKSAFENIAVKEANSWSKRKATRPASQAAPTRKGVSDGRCGSVVWFSSNFDFRLPVGVSIVLLNPCMNSRIS